MTDIRSVIIADPNTIMLQALSELFERDRRFSLVATAESAEGFLEAFLRAPVPLGVIDWHLPPEGTPTQGVEAGYMANAWVRLKHPDYDGLRAVMDGDDPFAGPLVGCIF